MISKRQTIRQTFNVSFARASKYLVRTEIKLFGITLYRYEERLFEDQEFDEQDPIHGQDQTGEKEEVDDD